MSDDKRIPKRAPLSNDMKISLSSLLQLRLLEEIGHFVARDETSEQIIFHGGTSLAIVHGSPRWSEDLDFMGSPDAVRKIMSRHRHIEAALQLRMSLEFPGSTVDIKLRQSQNTHQYGNVDRFQIRWEHPDYIGVVKVKAEFYICPPEHVADYKASACHPHSGGVISRSSILAADPASIWADKIVAIAQRPALKHRDIHDLGFLNANYPIGSRDERRAALKTTMGIYGRTAVEIDAGLNRDMIVAGERDLEGFRENMARWFTGPVMLDMEKTGELGMLFDGFLEEIDMGRDLIAEMAGPKCSFEETSCMM
jgi:predicted nucleotidyltransferase component of viral defense system